MYCRKCGTKLAENESICTNCGTPTNPEPTQLQQPINEPIKEGCMPIILGIIALVIVIGCFVLGKYSVTLGNTLSSEADAWITAIVVVGPLFGLVIAIFNGINYPKNKFARTVMWLYIIAAIIFVVTFIIQIVSCFNGLGDMG